MINVRWVLVPFLALTLGLVAACGGDSDDGDSGATTTTQTQTSSSATGEATGATTTTTQSGTASTTQSGTGGSAQSGDSLDMGQVATTLEGVDSFRFNIDMKMDFDTPQGGTGSQEDAAAAAMLMALLGNIQATGEYVAPDRYRVEMTIFGMHVESIQIGEEAWVNDGSGWVTDEMGGSFSTPFGGSPSALPFEFIPQEELKGAETSKESVNGFDTTRYHFDKDAIAALAEASDDPTAMGDLSEIDDMNMDIWVTEDGVPVKMLLALQGESEGSQISVDMEFNVTDLNDPSITIEPPL